MFAWFCRAIGLALALAIVIPDYKKTGDLITAIVWLCFFLVAFELLYWLSKLESLGASAMMEKIKAFFGLKPR
ncbi:hypothetical protein [Microvirga arsenatis]|uniref:Uncharacterized protein n=1 Tax=Microvirga arsenatis TaxID=2692265 RepID=A0ABW9YYB5_9HYPH|nr:hypothetical protein [Microvirga arsenatis]NBJ13324.1 hypothetical protein [Microvirga arsenatis]NBJ24108.1 hypothetical protein [Microvirga arsenatis]